MNQIPAAAFSLLYGTDIKTTQLAFERLSKGEVILLGVSGRMASGKDTIGPRVIDNLGYSHLAFHEFFAKALKHEINQVIEAIRDSRTIQEAIDKVSRSMSVLEEHARVAVNKLWQEVKDENVTSAYDRTATVRSILQYWGTDFRRKEDNDYWVKKTMKAMISQLAEGRSVFVTDARFENEVDALQRAGGYTIRLKVSRDVQIARLKSRDGIGPDLTALDHDSEKALDEYEALAKFSVVVDTDPLDAVGVLESVLVTIRHDLMLKTPSALKNSSETRSDPKSFFILNPVEPIILAVDLDEVCFDYLGGFRKRLEAQGLIIPAGKNTSWSLMKSGWVESEEEYKRLHAAAVLDGLYRDLEVLPGAKENMKDLSASGYELNIITSRFVIPGQHEIVVRETAHALDAARLPYSNIMFQRNKVRFLADAYLDDGPHNIESLRAAGRYVIKMNQLYNMYLGGPAADNWAEARQLLRERFGR